MTPIQIIGMTFRIMWVIIIMSIVFILEDERFGFIPIGFLSAYIFCSISYCESVANHPSGNDSTERWLWFSRLFSYTTMIAFLALLAYKISGL